jgi:hypothetical protein
MEHLPAHTDCPTSELACASEHIRRGIACLYEQAERVRRLRTAGADTDDAVFLLNNLRDGVYILLLHRRLIQAETRAALDQGARDEAFRPVA